MAHILIVDDEPEIRLALVELLTTAGHTVAESSNAEGIVERVAQAAPDLVLLDVSMPVVSGFDALAALKADRRSRRTPVVMVTGHGQPEEIAMARSMGASEYILKPWADGDVELIVDWVTSVEQAS